MARAEELFQRVDRLAGGRHAEVRADPEALASRPVRRRLLLVTLLLLLALLLGAGSIVAAAVFHTGGAFHLMVWIRVLVVFGITASLFYFLWRASRGWYWAYSRLRLFSMIFPFVALGLAAIPDLFPSWMVVEQVAFGMLLVLVSYLLGSDELRAAFPRPPRRARASRRDRGYGKPDGR